MGRAADGSEQQNISGPCTDIRGDEAVDIPIGIRLKPDFVYALGVARAGKR
jgi:hypothetical protein